MAIDNQRLFVLGGKGGIGKDLIAEGALLAASANDTPARLIEIEAAKRLGVFYPDTTSILFEALSPEELYADPDRVFQIFDTALDQWLGPGLSITCFGANITPALVVWARANGAERLDFGAGLTLAVVLTMNRHALAQGLSELFDLGEVFPAARRVAVLNEVHASFIAGDQHLARRLEEARGNGAPIETVRIPRCAAPAWGYLQNLGSLEHILDVDPQKLIDLGLPPGPVYRSKSIVTAWIADGLVEPLRAVLTAPKSFRSREARDD